MLVLTRSVDESIVIGKDIQIKLVEIDRRRGKIRLGISAPRDVPVFRSELLEPKNQTTEGTCSY